MGTAAEDVADKLAALGLGTVGTDIWIGVTPEKPDVIAAVNETGGIASEFGFSAPGLKYETPSVQIMMRGERGDYEGPRTRAETAYQGLAQVQAATLGSHFYHMIKPIQPPALISRDDDSRVLIAFNVSCTRAVT